MNRSYRTRHASSVPGWGPAPGWDQPLPGWTPLLDHGPLPLRAAGSVARWWWPTLAITSFLAVAVYVTGHDPGLSQRGLLTIALAALVVVLLTIHRTAGPGRLARAAAEYTVVALLAALLALAAAVRPAAGHPRCHGQGQAGHLGHPTCRRRRGSSWGAPGRAGVVRAVTTAIRAVTGAASWLVDLWRQADSTTDHPNRSPSTTTPQGEAMPSSPAMLLDVDQEVPMSLRFADLNPLGRAIIITVAALTFGVAAISFATSYGALYAYARDTGLYSERLTRLWPLLLDGAFIVAQLAAILRGHPPRQPRLAHPHHAPHRRPHGLVQPPARRRRPRPPPRRSAAAGADDAGLRDRHPDREMGHDRPRQAPRAHRSPTHRRHVAGAVWRSDGLDWNVPTHSLPGAWPPGTPGANAAGHRFPENSQNGQTRLPAAEGRDPARVTKRQRIEAYLDRLAPEQLRNLTVREITSDLQGEGLEVTERYVKHILDQRRPTPASRRRGSGPRSPRR